MGFCFAPIIVPPWAVIRYVSFGPGAWDYARWYDPIAGRYLS